MTTKVYCYHCMSYHPTEAVKQIMTPTGKRWRCIRSIEAAGASPKQRDAFGERQSELNRAKAEQMRNHSTRERLVPENRC